ncbi:MAG: hypothetical protein EXS32_00490 [Opitutus sp.]|nr:hypothetical protein [Opitutus sp.]
MNNIPEVAGVSAAVLIYVFCAFFALIPLFVWMQLRQIIKLLKKIEDTNERIADNTRPAGQRSGASSIKYISGIND